MPTYEEIVHHIEVLHTASRGGMRDVKWLTPAEVIGVARDKHGRLEIFLKGEELKASTQVVRDTLEYHEWHRLSGGTIPANRILFPALGHFDQVAAFICTELLRNDADQDVTCAFHATEAIIALSIERLLLSNSALLGLVGELLLLNALCHQVDRNLVGSIIQCWDGWRRSSRDFTWDRTGIEVKTTTSSLSSHKIQGVHQIEPALGDGDTLPEDRLLLVSVGLQPAATGPNSITVPDLVRRIIDRLNRTGNSSQVEEFCTRVSRYGSESGFGYDHSSMQNDAPFTSAFAVTFFRTYDMSDSAVEVIRRDDVVGRRHVDTGSVNFRINLPVSVSSSNPIAGANQAARLILGI